MLAHQTVELGKAPLGDDADRPRKLDHRWVGQPVMDEESLLAALDQTCLAKGKQVLRSVGERKPRFLGERVDRALALRQDLEELQAVRAGETFADSGELSVEAGPVRAEGGGVGSMAIIYLSI